MFSLKRLFNPHQPFIFLTQKAIILAFTNLEFINLEKLASSGKNFLGDKKQTNHINDTRRKEVDTHHGTCISVQYLLVLLSLVTYVMVGLVLVFLRIDTHSC